MMTWPAASTPDSVELTLRPTTSGDTLLSAPSRTNGLNEDAATTSGVTDGAGDEDVHRVIFVHRPQPQKFISNRITTAKYNCATFIPLFLFEQFRRYSNCFFLLIALLQQIPDVSPTGRWTTLTPLILILSVSALKEIVEDFKRHRADDETNRREVFVLQNGAWMPVRWDQLRVGDVCRITNDQFFPADLVLISSSEPQGISFIETANLDGETNLKIRQAHPDTAKIISLQELENMQAALQCDNPNRHLYEFNGTFKETSKRSIALGLEQMLLRGSKLRNTAWIQGVVVYTGHETKLMMNSTKAPLKRSTIDKQTNTHILLLFIILLLLSLLSATCYQLWYMWYAKQHWYIGLDEMASSNVGFNFLTFLILYNNLIPISLQVTAEIVRFFQAKFIAMDCEMYHEETDTPACARTSNLNEELGMVKYIFSDKTGTLTCNVMEFHKCSIAEEIYESPGPNEKPSSSPLYRRLQSSHEDSAVHREFLTMLAICHTVIPEHDGDRINYHAASPDERALVEGAARFGFVFTSRSPRTVEVLALGSAHTYTILHVIEFTSARKRMSVIVQTENGDIKLYCKGADSVIYSLLSGGDASGSGARFADVTLAHLETFAHDGLRTLVFAYRDVTQGEYQEWANTYHKASIAIQNREEKIEEAAVLIENNLKLLGATGIEDKLQDGVPETIAALLKANIHVWVLTGDKQETAINIAHSARLIDQHMAHIILNEHSLDATRETIHRHIADFGDNLRKDNSVALVVDGQTLKYAMGCELKKDFLDLCISCKVLLCCRVSPLQKAEVVELITRSTGSVTLAVGDGANDVAMIQRASVGVGISGVEGLQAVCASDYSIAQFRFLLRLLLVHGAWNYSRISKLILYSFYKNICLYVIELWFAIYSAWSGQILFERWSIGFYNVIFTALPPFAIGLFDKICSPDVMVRFPALYIPSQQGMLFNVRVFWIWAGNAIVHSILAFWLGVLLCRGDVMWGHGKDGGYLLMGNCVYTYVVMIVCLKSGLATHSWTWLTHVSIWGSVLLWLVFVLVYSNIYPIVLIGSVMAGMDRMLFTSVSFWVAAIVIPTFILLSDLFTTVIRNTVFKSVTEMVRESEIKKRDPEHLLESHRNSLTETARLLQNVRSVFSRRSNTRVNLELELSHGFAFSQEEGAAVSQTDIIRAYDTSQPRLS